MRHPIARHLLPGELHLLRPAGLAILYLERGGVCGRESDPRQPGHEAIGGPGRPAGPVVVGHGPTMAKAKAQVDHLPGDLGGRHERPRVGGHGGRMLVPR